jgi:hypothetical protein
MSSHSRQPVSEDDTRARCWVAVLDTQSLLLMGKDYTSYLSAAEKAHHRAFRSSKRRLQWLGGRLATKYLFLHRMELPVANEEPIWRPILLQLSVKSVDDYPIRMYQNIEVSASVDPEGTGPRLRWRGRAEGAVSLSHRGSNVCACLSQASTVGVDIDIESVEPRVESFYRSNYTETEKQWVNCGAGRRLILSVVKPIDTAQHVALAVMP